MGGGLGMVVVGGALASIYSVVPKRFLLKAKSYSKQLSQAQLNENTPPSSQLVSSLGQYGALVKSQKYVHLVQKYSYNCIKK